MRAARLGCPSHTLRGNHVLASPLRARSSFTRWGFLHTGGRSGTNFIAWGLLAWRAAFSRRASWTTVRVGVSVYTCGARSRCAASRNYQRGGRQSARADRADEERANPADNPFAGCRFWAVRLETVDARLRVFAPFVCLPRGVARAMAPRSSDCTSGPSCSFPRAVGGSWQVAADHAPGSVLLRSVYTLPLCATVKPH